MRIISYEFSQTVEGWSFNKVELGTINLVVGDTGTGKTRFLNTIFNLGAIVNGIRPLAGPSHWKLTFDIDGSIFGWDIQSNKTPDNKTLVEREHLWSINGSKNETIIDRTPNTFIFTHHDLPKLPRENLSVSLLKEEELIRPIFNGFGRILRRNFFENALQVVLPVSISDPKLLETPIKDLEHLPLDTPLNIKLLLLKKYLPSIYDSICYQYTNVFSFIKDFDIKDITELYPGIGSPGPTPVLCIKEKYIKNWIDIGQISSGMQKVLLILTDIHTLPKGSVYLIDEYENSLGITAIDFFHTFLSTFEGGVQFIITSHHPYLINNIPVENWLVFHRRGSKVTIRYGTQNIEAYGKSKQQRFIQLVNDPFYAGENA